MGALGHWQRWQQTLMPPAVRPHNGHVGGAVAGSGGSVTRTSWSGTGQDIENGSAGGAMRRFTQGKPPYVATEMVKTKCNLTNEPSAV